MVNPIERAVNLGKDAFGGLPTGINPNVIESPVRQVTPIKTGMGGGNATSNVNFNISGVNAQGGAGQFQGQQMRQYVEGVAMQVAHNVLRQNTQFGGLV